MYKNYIFDLYGTLVDIHTNEKKKYLWEKMAYMYCAAGARYTYDELREQYKIFCDEEINSVKARTGRPYCDIKIEKIFKRLYHFKGVKAGDAMAVMTAQTFRCISVQYIKLYDGVTEVLDRIKDEGKRIYLLSNAQRVFTEPELRITGIAEYFDGIIISSDEETAKPSTEIFDILFERYNINKKESIMIGNDYGTDIKGGVDAGVDTLYIHSNLSTEYSSHVDAKFLVADGEFSKIIGNIL